MVYSGKEVDTRDILKDYLTRQYARLVQEIHTKTVRANSKF